MIDSKNTWHGYVHSASPFCGPSDVIDTHTDMYRPDIYFYPSPRKTKIESIEHAPKCMPESEVSKLKSCCDPIEGGVTLQAQEYELATEKRWETEEEGS